MIGNDQRICSHVHCASCVLWRVDTFNHDWPVPRLANPFHVRPSHNGLLESSSDIGIQHWPLSRDDDILKFHQAAVRDELASSIDCRNRVSRGQCDELFAPAVKETARGDDECTGPLSHNGLKGRVDVDGGAGIQHNEPQPESTRGLLCLWHL